MGGETSAFLVDTLRPIKPPLWERACSRTAFASRLAPTDEVFLQPQAAVKNYPSNSRSTRVKSRQLASSSA
jgi:hypothetical protein